MEKKKMDKKKFIMCAATGALIGICLFAVANQGKKTDTAETTVSSDYTPGVMVTQNFGDSDSFYKGEEGKSVLVDFGAGQYDITNDIVKWSFGAPVISLKKVAEITGLTLSMTPPENYNPQSYYEIYAPDETIDTTTRTPFYLIDGSGNYLQYKLGSSYIFDQDGKETAVSYFPEANPNDKDDAYVSVMGIPYVEGGVIEGVGMPSFDYRAQETIITIGKPQDTYGTYVTDETAGADGETGSDAADETADLSAETSEDVPVEDVTDDTETMSEIDTETEAITETEQTEGANE